MSRRGRLALLVLLLIAAASALAAPAFGQAVSLHGETFETVGVGHETTFGPFTCDGSGTSTISFETHGLAFGPYSGTFTESGTFTIGPQTLTDFDPRGVGPIRAFESTFTIQSEFPAGTVTGTKRLAPAAPSEVSLASFARCDPDGPSPADVYMVVPDPFLLYDAQIHATTGSRTDSGTASVLIQTIPPPPATATFQESFNSTEPPACEDGNNGLGVGPGHAKKKNDRDEAEEC